MNTPQLNPKEGRVRLHLILALTFLVLMPVFIMAQAPTWWSERNVINENPANDYGAVNQGQVKNIAVAAVAELNVKLEPWGGAGTALDNLAGALSTTGTQTNDYAAVNLGQLKNLAQPFFDRLLEAGYHGHPLKSGTYPWVEGAANDYAVANIGQVKNLFAFDLVGFDPDDPELMDGWDEWLEENGLTVSKGAWDAANGVTYWQDYVQGRTPNAGFEDDSAHGAVQLQVFTPLQ